MTKDSTAAAAADSDSFIGPDLFGLTMPQLEALRRYCEGHRVIGEIRSIDAEVGAQSPLYDLAAARRILAPRRKALADALAIDGAGSAPYNRGVALAMRSARYEP